MPWSPEGVPDSVVRLSDGSLTRSTRIGLGKSEKRRTVGEKPYHIVGEEATEELAKFPAKNGQALLPNS